MDDLAILFALGLAAVVLLVPVVALVMTLTARRAQKDLRQTVDELQSRLAQTEWWIGELVRRMEAKAAATRESSPKGSVDVPAETPGPSPPADRAMTNVTGELLRSTPPTSTSPSTPPSIQLPASQSQTDDNVTREKPRSFDLEKLVGVRLFAWLGGIGLFIGAAFFLEYSIEHDLIAPPLRVGIGLLVGAVAVALGDYVKAKADRAGQALAGGGVATLYASLFAARSLYELIPSWAAFAGMILVTALSGLIAVRRDAFMLAVIGLVGGFATPWLLSTGEDRRYALFAYVLLLDAGVLVVSAKRKWVSLPVTALAGSAVLYAGWASEYLSSNGVLFALVVAALLGALFVAANVARATPDVRPNVVLRAVAIAGVIGPFLAALATASRMDFHASLLVLVVYLAVLLVGVFGLTTRWRTPFILEAAAALSVATLAARIRSDVAQEGVLPFFALLCVVPAVLFALYLWRRSTEPTTTVAARRALGIALSGSWLLLTLAYALPAGDSTAPIAPYGFYAAAHVASMIAVALVEASSVWLVLAQGTWLLVLLTLTTIRSPYLDEVLTFVLAPMLAFFSLPVLTPRARATPLGWISAASSLVTHYTVLYLLARGVWSDATLGMGAIAAAGLALALLRFAQRRVLAAESPSVVAALGGITLLFLLAAVPITLSKQWITVAWGLEAAALAWLYLRIPHKGLLATSALLAISTTVRLLANPWLWEYHARSGTIVFNWYLYTFGLPALAFFAAAFLLRSDATARRWQYPRGLWFVGGVLVFVLLNVEIADSYSTGQTIGVHLGASLGEDMTYSLGWGSFGLVVLLVGMRFQSASARMCALAVLLLTIGKVFLHDLWHLGALYRVGSTVGLAVALLLVSFLTQRFILRGNRS